ncbi:MAG TPA: hypothetical protein VH325_02025 [Bryobacteraceae bacterium]|nr:hypothetical protein [Bryobacteraceae bacterium]
MPKLRFGSPPQCLKGSGRVLAARMSEESLKVLFERMREVLLAEGPGELLETLFGC